MISILCMLKSNVIGKLELRLRLVFFGCFLVVVAFLAIRVRNNYFVVIF